uniref:AMP-activated protein kinase glycogen-binding domain-containing protein n=1 Tax=Panagrolaimus sp. ES5 TaxID=591445 RepID=A0AC34FW76_9BILA
MGEMGATLARLLHSFLNLFGTKSKDLRLDSPLPKDEVEGAAAREIRLPKLLSKKEWEKFKNQPTLSETDLNSPNGYPRLLHSFLNLFGTKSKDLRLDSPLPKDEVEGAAAREIRLPKLLSKKEWEKFMYQPTLSETDLNSPNGYRQIELEYIDPTPTDLKLVLVALASFNWKMAQMTPSQDSKGIYKLKFNNPTPECVFKFVVNDQWMTSDKYSTLTDAKGNQNNYV